MRSFSYPQIFPFSCIGFIARANLYVLPQNYLFGIVGENKHRKAEKLALMLNCIFDMATEDYNFPSPMKKVVLPAYQTKKGEALTKDEETRLVNYCKSHKNVEGTDALLVLLYFGLRKSELASIEIIDGKWLQCETSKERLGQNVVLRKIPFTPQVKKVLPYIDFEESEEHQPQHHFHAHEAAAAQSPPARTAAYVYQPLQRGRRCK